MDIRDKRPETNYLMKMVAMVFMNLEKITMSCQMTMKVICLGGITTTMTIT
jgi:hypothetical protein